MGKILKVSIQVAVFAMLLGGIGWFVAFETDPYSVCIDHPNPQYSDRWFQCKPFNRVIKKPKAERRFRDGKY